MTPNSEQSLRWGQWQTRSMPPAFHPLPNKAPLVAAHVPLPLGARAYIVDEDESSVWVVRGVLAGASIEVVYRRSVQDFLALYSPGECDCLIVDVGPSPLEPKRHQDVAQANETLPTIFMKADPQFDDAVKAMRWGALDFFAKPLIPSQLVPAVHSALRASHSAHLRRLQANEEEARKAMLTTRELVIVQGVIAGNSSKEIAEHLHISVRTVDNHKARVYSKLNINSSLALARLFTGLIRPASDWRLPAGRPGYMPAKG